MYLARFSYDVLPVDRGRAIDFHSTGGEISIEQGETRMSLRVADGSRGA